jgi:hypothetical protein
MPGYFCIDKKHVSNERIVCSHEGDKWDCKLRRDVIVVNKGIRDETYHLGMFSIVDTSGLIVKAGAPRRDSVEIQAKDNDTRCVVSEKKDALVCVWPIPLKEEQRYPCNDLAVTLAPKKIASRNKSF